MNTFDYPIFRLERCLLEPVEDGQSEFYWVLLKAKVELGVAQLNNGEGTFISSRSDLGAFFCEVQAKGNTPRFPYMG